MPRFLSGSCSFENETRPSSLQLPVRFNSKFLTSKGTWSLTHFARNLFLRALLKKEKKKKKRFDQSFSFSNSILAFSLFKIGRKIGATSGRDLDNSSIVTIVSPYRFSLWNFPTTLLAHKAPWRIPARFAGLRIRGYDDLSNVELRHKLGSCACHVPLLWPTVPNPLAAVCWLSGISG